MEGGIWDPETEKKGIILFDPSDLYDVVEKRDWGIVVICPARDLVRGFISRILFPDFALR